MLKLLLTIVATLRTQISVGGYDGMFQQERVPFISPLAGNSHSSRYCAVPDIRMLSLMCILLYLATSWINLTI
jgi:hypothetical protein